MIGRRRKERGVTFHLEHGRVWDVLAFILFPLADSTLKFLISGDHYDRLSNEAIEWPHFASLRRRVNIGLMSHNIDIES